MTFGMAAMMVITRRFRGIPILRATFLASLLSGVFSMPFAERLWADGPHLLELIFFGLVNSAVGIVFFTLGSQLLPPIETGLITLLEVPMGPAWVWLIFGESPSAATIVGGLIVLASVVAHTVVGARATGTRVARASAAASNPPTNTSAEDACRKKASGCACRLGLERPPSRLFPPFGQRKLSALLSPWLG